MNETRHVLFIFIFFASNVSGLTGTRFETSATVYLTNRSIFKSRDRKAKHYFPERLKLLDAVSPVSRLDQWWPTAKAEMGVSEAVDNQFVWYDNHSS
jgi:hypothetical protein